MSRQQLMDDGWAEVARLRRQRKELRKALHAMMAAVLAFQHEDARKPDYKGNPYYCPLPDQGHALLKAYDLASIARANSPLNKTDD